MLSKLCREIVHGTIKQVQTTKLIGFTFVPEPSRQEAPSHSLSQAGMIR